MEPSTRTDDDPALVLDLWPDEHHLQPRRGGRTDQPAEGGGGSSGGVSATKPRRHRRRASTPAGSPRVPPADGEGDQWGGSARDGDGGRHAAGPPALPSPPHPPEPVPAPRDAGDDGGAAAPAPGNDDDWWASAPVDGGPPPPLIDLHLGPGVEEDEESLLREEGLVANRRQLLNPNQFRDRLVEVALTRPRHEEAAVEGPTDAARLRRDLALALQHAGRRAGENVVLAGVQQPALDVQAAARRVAHVTAHALRRVTAAAASRRAAVDAWKRQIEAGAGVAEAVEAAKQAEDRAAAVLGALRSRWEGVWKAVRADVGPVLDKMAATKAAPEGVKAAAAAFAVVCAPRSDGSPFHDLACVQATAAAAVGRLGDLAKQAEVAAAAGHGRQTLANVRVAVQKLKEAGAAVKAAKARADRALLGEEDGDLAALEAAAAAAAARFKALVPAVVKLQAAGRQARLAIVAKAVGLPALVQRVRARLQTVSVGQAQQAVGAMVDRQIRAGVAKAVVAARCKEEEAKLERARVATVQAAADEVGSAWASVAFPALTRAQGAWNAAEQRHPELAGAVDAARASAQGVLATVQRRTEAKFGSVWR